MTREDDRAAHHTEDPVSSPTRKVTAQLARQRVGEAAAKASKDAHKAERRHEEAVPKTAIDGYSFVVKREELLMRHTAISTGGAAPRGGRAEGGDRRLLVRCEARGDPDATHCHHLYRRSGATRPCSRGADGYSLVVKR